MRTTRLKEKIAKLAEEMKRLEALEVERRKASAGPADLADRPRCSLHGHQSGRGSGVVGYNVQAAVDTEHHLIVTHEVTNVGNDRCTTLPDGQARPRPRLRWTSWMCRGRPRLFRAARRSWPASRPASRSPCRSRRPRAPRLQGPLSPSRTSAMSAMRTSISARPGSA